MEIHYLHEFVTIAKCGSFSLAAEDLNLSQSSLSKHIKALERELETTLFDRSTRSVTLSETGKLLLPYAHDIIEAHSKLRNLLNEQAVHKRQILSIASIPMMAQYKITSAIAKFNNKFPAIRLDVRETESKDIIDCLENRSCELAFWRSSAIYSPELESLPLYTDHMMAVLPKQHCLAHKQSLNLSQLSGESFLLLDQNTLLYSLCTAACERAGFVPHITYMGKRPETIIELVAKNMGIALLMNKHVDYVKHPSVISIKIVPEEINYICMIRLKNKRHSESASLFWNFIRQHAHEFQ